ncbi:hypothetical protein V5799_009924 [Amblyomma americanum]|uniref:SMB domain-containing protein n=1 Tax=Amblyomma americanum TaxID=6943 RepID=A0AAQ4FA83_AMBAM
MRLQGRASGELPVLLLCATLLVCVPSIWSVAVQGPNVDGEAWWAPVRHESLLAGVCTSGEDLCDSVASSNVCRCDADCAKYGDCCLDRTDGSLTSPDARADGARSPWRCLFVNGREFYGLASCPHDPAVDPDLLNHCLGKGDQLKTLQDVPVYSNASRIMYANVFCAACHNDLQGLIPWHLELRCNRALEANTVLSSLARGRYGKMSHALHGADGLTCRLQVADVASEAFWHEVPGLRECRIAASSCRKGAAPRDVRLCSSYTAYVYSPRKFSNYRNFHCFRCAHNLQGGIECGARPATFGHDAPDVSHLVMGMRSHFVNARRCWNTSTHIYDPLGDVCYETPVLPSEEDTGDEPSYAPAQRAASSMIALIVVLVVAGRIEGIFLTRD